MDRTQVSGYRARDNGRGSAKDFEPFYSDFRAGKGIGMSVVKRIVDDYKGKIEIQSDLNKGTEIVISLPHQEQASQLQLIMGD